MQKLREDLLVNSHWQWKRYLCTNWLCTNYLKSPAPPIGGTRGKPRVFTLFSLFYLIFNLGCLVVEEFTFFHGFVIQCGGWVRVWQGGSVNNKYFFLCDGNGQNSVELDLATQKYIYEIFLKYCTAYQSTCSL